MCVTKEKLAKAYYDWYRQDLANRSGCGGPILIAGFALALVMYLIF